MGGEDSGSQRNSENKVCTYKHCKKLIVRDSVECVECGATFHPGCFNKGKQDSISNHTCELTSNTKGDSVYLITQIETLTKLIQHLEESNNSLRANNEALLATNNYLLNRLQNFEGNQISINTETDKIINNNNVKQKQMERGVTQSGEQNSNANPISEVAESNPVTKKTYKEKLLYGKSDKNVNNNFFQPTEQKQNKTTENLNLTQEKRKINERRKQRDSIIGTATESSKLSAVPRLVYYFLGRVKTQITSEDVNKFIKDKICPEGALEVTELKLKRDTEKAFKIGIMQKFEEHFKNPSIWPADLKLQKYSFFAERKRIQNTKK